MKTLLLIARSGSAPLGLDHQKIQRGSKDCARSGVHYIGLANAWIQLWNKADECGLTRGTANGRRISSSRIYEDLGTMGRKASGAIAELIRRFLATKDNLSRQNHRPDEVDIDQMIQAGEKFVREWQV
jgi:hypothetical protein